MLLMAEPVKPKSGRGRKLIRWTGGLAFLVLISVAIWYWLAHRPAGTDAASARLGARMTTTVGIAVAKKGNIEIFLSGLGTVTPPATVTVKPQVSGQLIQVAFTEGQHVKKGEFLAQIDPRPFQAVLDQQEGQLEKDRALLENARVDLVRYQKLNSQDSVSHQTLDTQVALVHQYEGTVKADQGQVESAQVNLDYCHIVSPVDGVVGLRQVDQGNYVQTSDSSGLVVITQIDPMTVIFTVTEDDISKVTARLTAGADLPVTVYDRTNTTEIAEGKLGSVDNQVDTTTGDSEAEGGLRQPRRKAFSPTIRQRETAGGYVAGCDHRPDGCHPDRRAGVVRIRGEFRFDGFSSRDQTGTDRRGASRRPLRP